MTSSTDPQPEASVDRRRFLTLAVTGAAALGVVGCRSSGSPPGPSGDLESTPESERTERPRLILLLGTGRAEERGMLWGRFLDEAPAASVAPLAFCDLAATSVWIARRSSGFIGRDPDLMPMGLVEPGDGRRVEVGSTALAPDPWLVEQSDGALALTKWFDALAQDLRRVLALDDEAVLARGRALLGQPELARDEVNERLAARVRASLAHQAPGGARWATYVGACGDVLLDSGERVGPVGVCGTAFLPAPAQRFLYLYTR